MKLYKALKLKKKLVGEINFLKEQINEKNSALQGSANAEKFDVRKLWDELVLKTNELINLKFVINEANANIQHKLYVMAETKSLIAFWKNVDITEGKKMKGYSDTVQEYVVHMDEKERNKIVSDFQNKVDALQEEIDVHNHSVDVPLDSIEF